MPNCLDGIRVLELARFQAGPRGGMLLSDLGAEVIKIEPPGGEETRKHPPLVRGQSVYFSVYNRGKKSVCLDLRKAQGKEIFAALVAKADVVLENFRPGVMRAMGFDYERLAALNPGIILVSVSGFGQYGPYTERPAFDSLGQAMSGLMSLTGQPEGKPIGTASSVVDRYTALHATIGMLAALRHRERTGEGQLVDVCLLDSALTMVEIPTSYYLATGKEGGEGGRPPYKTRNGFVVIAAAGRDMAGRLMQIVRGSSAEGDTTPLAGSTGPDDRRALIDRWCAERTTDEICAMLHEAGIPSAPVRTVPQVAQDPHLWQREMLVKMEDAIAGEMYLPGATIKLSKTPARVGPVPTVGQHTNETLSKLLDYDANRLATLRSAGVIA